MYNNNNNYNNRQVPKMNAGNYRYLNNVNNSVETGNRNYNNGNSKSFNSRCEMSAQQNVLNNNNNNSRHPVEKVPLNGPLCYTMRASHSNTNFLANNCTYNPPQATSAFALPILETPSPKVPHFPTPTTPAMQPLNSTSKFNTNLKMSNARLNESNFESEGNARKKLKTSDANENNQSTYVKTKGSLTRVFTGTVEKVIKWNKVYKEYFCFYEIIGSLVSIQEGPIKMQRILLVRDKKGPIMQIIHYETDHIHIENFVSGQMLRCVGRMVGPNILHAISIREATGEEVSTLLRMCYICDHAIQRVLAEMSNNN